MFVSDLSRYPERAVIGALSRCRREVKGILTVSDVVSRLEDGRPGVEEAWSMLPLSEQQSACWTDEMAKAFGPALPMIERGDHIGARMAFKEAYAKAVTNARDAGKPVSWSVTLGLDPSGRKPVVEEAVKLGRLTMDEVNRCWPELGFSEAPELITNEVRKALEQPKKDQP
jgi:hypothetical protein